MSRFVDWDGRIYPASFVEPWETKPGDCTRCGGAGEYPETIDEERYDVMVPCFMCRRFCKACNDYVRKSGHECKEAKL